MVADPWLERWLPTLVQRCGATPVLELGCGSGADTATLVAAGLPVLALELDPAAAARARQRVPAAQVRVQDLREPFPPEARALGVVLASLSLHYFSWAETQAIVARIRAALHPGGLLLCRLNSTQDLNFGAASTDLIEPGLLRVDGRPKRFFDAAAVEALFGSGWRRLSMEHLGSLKYGPAKALWELAAERTDP